MSRNRRTKTEKASFIPRQSEERADVVLWVEQDGSGDKRYKYQLICDHPNLARSYGPYVSPQNLSDYIRLLENRIRRINGIYASYEKAIINQGLNEEVIARLQKDLELIGLDLYTNLFDGEFKKTYWESLRNTNISSLVIHSDELRIPWELIKPHHENIEDSFWGERFELARYPKNLRMPRTIEVERLVILSPFLAQQSCEAGRRDSAQRELEVIRENLNGIDCNEVQDHSKIALEKLFRTPGAFSHLHYFGHCKFEPQDPDESYLLFANGEKLLAREVTGISLGFASNGSQPFIFINACASAGSDFYFSGVNGWVKVFIHDAKCSGFIGTSWEVSHFAACKFSEFFYDDMINSNDVMTVASALRSARLNLKLNYPGDPSWLSYTVYAEPFARFLLLQNSTGG
jgi:hypothetical protein